jgi:hypothetical protein
MHEVTKKIDSFVSKKLQAEGLNPSAKADKETLIRRLAFVLTGLPPTLQQLEAFVADEREDAYERLAAVAEAEGKAMDELVRELVEQALPSVSYAQKSTKEILRDAGLLTELSNDLKALIGDDPPSLDEVIEILSKAGGPSLGEILDQQRGPKP